MDLSTFMKLPAGDKIQESKVQDKIDKVQESNPIKDEICKEASITLSEHQKLVSEAIHLAYKEIEKNKEKNESQDVVRPKEVIQLSMQYITNASPGELLYIPVHVSKSANQTDSGLHVTTVRGNVQLFIPIGSFQRQV